MNSGFQLIVQNLSVIAAVFSVIATLISLLITLRESRKKLKGIKDTDFDAVIDSSDIATLGKYLDETLGNFNIYEYSSNPVVTSQVDKYLDRIKGFVGTVDEIKIEPEEPIPERDFYGINEKALPDDFQPIIEELKTGEPWNALARLRRLIEINLRQLATESDFPEKKLKSAGYLLRFMERKYDLNKNVTGLLSYSINVCNKAIHGKDVSVGEAEEAIYSAAKTLPEILEFVTKSRTNQFT